MPEGHSIHRIARQFNDVFTGESVRVSSPQGRYTDGAALLDGASILNAYAHGKHLFVPFNNELTLNVHLGIYGNWSFGGDETFTGASSIGAPRKIGEKEYTAGEAEEYTGPPAPKGTTRCRIVSEHGWADLVGPTICRTLNPDEGAQVRAKLGPDPLNTGVRVGRIITTEQKDRPGIHETEAWPEHANYVYQHHGEPCPRCGTTIRMEEIAGRKLYWCPGCQK